MYDEPFSEKQQFLNSTKSNASKFHNDETKRDTAIEFCWKNIYVKPKKPLSNTKKGSSKSNKVSDSQTKFILDNVSGKVKSGEALAILGASGAGKTTLLNLLSKKIESKNLAIEGNILLNNQKVDSGLLNAISSYVMQDDVLESTMTPVEVLLFTAKLKINNLSDEQIENKVENMIQKLNLQNAKNTKIGNELKRGVSGGERKRTSIGVELISDPQIIFLDEPTTGLDSFNAFEVIENLCTLAKEDNRLIIFTIHQPSSEIFNLLDNICILADGKTIYFGARNNILDCFNELFKLPCKPFYNPFEHFMEMTTLNCIFRPDVREQYPALSVSEVDQDEVKFGEYSKHMNALANIFENNKHKFFNNENEIDGFSDDLKEIIENKKSSKGFCFEYLTLLGRNVMRSHRNLKLLYFKMFQNLFTAIIQCLLYYQVFNYLKITNKNF